MGSRVILSFCFSMFWLNLNCLSFFRVRVFVITSLYLFLISDWKVCHLVRSIASIFPFYSLGKRILKLMWLGPSKYRLFLLEFRYSTLELLYRSIPGKFPAHSISFFTFWNDFLHSILLNNSVGMLEVQISSLVLCYSSLSLWLFPFNQNMYYSYTSLALKNIVFKSFSEGFDWYCFNTSKYSFLKLRF